MCTAPALYVRCHVNSDVWKTILIRGFWWCDEQDNWTPLHFACRAGHLPIVNYLLKQGVAIDAPTKSRWTPLHMACDRGRYEIAEILLTCGADPAAVDSAGHTPAHYAQQKQHHSLLELLQEFASEAAPTQN